MYLLLIFVVVLLVFSMVQNNRRRKSVAAMQTAIEPGVRIMTTSGIYGIVQEVEADSIIIEISEGVDVRFAKAAVMKVVPHLDETDDLDELDETDALDDVADDSLGLLMRPYSRERGTRPLYHAAAGPGWIRLGGRLTSS